MIRKNFSLPILLACGALTALGQQNIAPGGPTPFEVLNGSATLAGSFDPNQMLRVVLGLQPPNWAEGPQPDAPRRARSPAAKLGGGAAIPGAIAASGIAAFPAVPDARRVECTILAIGDGCARGGGGSARPGARADAGSAEGPAGPDA